MQLFVIVYIKSDDITKEMLLKDLESYFDKVCEVENNWKEHKDNFELVFWFHYIILRRQFIKEQAAEGAITQGGIDTFREFTQKEERGLMEGLKKAAVSSKMKGDPRLVTLKSVEQYV